MSDLNIWKERALKAEADLAAIRAQLNQQTDMVEKCMVAMNENADRGQKAEAALSATADWLWCQFMDWCKKRKVAPANYDDLFEIVHKVRIASPAASPDVGALVEAITKRIEEAIKAHCDGGDLYVCALIAAEEIQALTQSQAARVPDANMFWNNDDSERCYGSIDEFLNEEICNGSPIEVGAVFTIQQARRLDNLRIKVTSINEEECEAEYEVLPAAPGKGGAA